MEKYHSQFDCSNMPISSYGYSMIKLILATKSKGKKVEIIGKKHSFVLESSSLTEIWPLKIKCVQELN